MNGPDKPEYFSLIQQKLCNTDYLVGDFPNDATCQWDVGEERPIIHSLITDRTFIFADKTGEHKVKRAQVQSFNH